MMNGREHAQAVAETCRRHGRLSAAFLKRGCGLLMAVCLTGMAATAVQANEQAALTPELIKEKYPDLYRQIQAAPKLPPKVDPQKPYGDYGGFLAHPKFLPGQPDNWWERSSFDYSPEYPYFLKTVFTKFSYARMSGNDDGHALKGDFYLGMRQGRITNHLIYSVNKKHITNPDGGSSKSETQGFEESLQYEFNRYLFAEGGVFWQRMSPLFIKSRLTPFIGVGSHNVLQDILNKKKDTLELRVGVGYVMDSYDSTVKKMIEKDSEEFKGAYLRAKYSHYFTDKFVYRQEFTLKHAIDKTNIYGITTIPQADLDKQHGVVLGKTLRYDWRWSNTLEFNLNQYVGFLVQYSVAYDSNPWPVARKRDTELMTGIKFAY